MNNINTSKEINISLDYLTQSPKKLVLIQDNELGFRRI